MAKKTKKSLQPLTLDYTLGLVPLDWSKIGAAKSKTIQKDRKGKKHA